MTTFEKIIAIGLTGLLAYSVLKNDRMEKDIIELEEEYKHTIQILEDHGIYN